MFANIFADKSDNFFLDPWRYIRRHDICNIGSDSCSLEFPKILLLQPAGCYPKKISELSHENFHTSKMIS